MFSNKKIVYSVLTLAVLGVGIGAAARKQPAKHETVSAPQAGTPVEIGRATVGTVAQWTPVTGSLVSLQDVALSSRLAGRLASVMVREGDPVTAGQVIARLDTTDLEAQVHSAEGAVAAAQARVAQADASYRQQVVTSRSGVESAEAVYQQQVVSSRANVDSAEAALQSAKAALSQVQEGSRRQDIAKAETQVAIARATLNKAQVDAHRYAELLKDGAVAAVTAEQYQTSYEVAKEQMRAAEQSLSLVKEGARLQEVEQAEQNVRQAEERLQQAKAARAQDAVRRADLQAARAARSQDEVRQAEAKAARASLQQAFSSLEIAHKNLADATIISPVSGQVASRTAEPGQVVSPGGTILRVVSLNAVYFEPSVQDRELGHLKVGQSVEISVDAYPKRAFTGHIVRIYPAGAAQSRTFPIRIAVDNQEGLLRPQMYARGRIETERHANATLIPRDALLADKSGTKGDKTARLFVVENGQAHEREVTLGMLSPDGQHIEASGITAGAQVVTAGHRSLAEGDKVAVKQGTGGEMKVTLNR